MNQVSARSLDRLDSERIHDASLALLSDPGVKVEHDSVRALLIQQGAREGLEADTVRLPAPMVQEALRLCPREVILCDRRGACKTLRPEGDSTIWSTPGMYVLEANRRRPFTSLDMARFSRLLENLETVDVIFGLALHDVPPPARDVIGLVTIAENSSKHIRPLCFSPEGARTMAEMRHVIGDYPWFSVGFTAHGPLRWTNLAIEIFAKTAGQRIPVSVNGEPMAGVTGPVTIAGAAAVGNAEILAGIVINQILEPGRPCIYNLGLAHIMDMRTAIAVTGAPENALFARLSAAMGRFYDIPSASWVSTEAMTCDAQAALEKMFGFTTHMFEGVSAIWGTGQIESELTVSPAMAVIDDEMVRYVRRYVAGAAVNDETLALGVARDVGIGGSYLDHVHTLQRFRSEFYSPRILCREKRERWEESGARDLAARADDVARDLIAREVETGMSEDQTRALKQIASRFLARISES